MSTPSDLIKDKRRTPFNIGRAIDLTGFQLDEVQPLAQGLAAVGNAQELMEAVLKWTGGQPFLTQKLCKLVLQSALEVERWENEGQAEIGDWAAGLVRKRIIENWEGQDEPEHLKTIRDRILRSGEQRTGRLLGLCQQILQQGKVAADDSPEQTELRLTGLVVKRDGDLRIYNRIYQVVFNNNWCEKELRKLRFYADALNTWVASERQDESRLLLGKALEDALDWAENKSLSDLDYQFLAASQESDKRKQIEAQKQANQILQMATDKANRRIRFGSIILTVSIVGAIIASIGVYFADQQRRREALEGSRLEQAGKDALTQRDLDQIGSLVMAMRTGKDLQKIVNDRPIEKYPATSPVLALQNILNKIQARNQLEGHQKRVNDASFSADSKLIVTVSDDKTAKIWDISGKLLTTLEGHKAGDFSR